MKFFLEKGTAISIRKRIEVIDLHLKRVFVGRCDIPGDPSETSSTLKLEYNLTVSLIWPSVIYVNITKMFLLSVSL